MAEKAAESHSESMEGESNHSDDDDFPIKENIAVPPFRRKQGIISLKRSLVMKKIWEKRRQVPYPDRTSKRQLRTYHPRGSRVRDCGCKVTLKPLQRPQAMGSSP
ncbi:uncharacterized protein LOC122243037 [Penaeus japonicus]|uniref:uncharacterized protein LOC122243037 n=1 Tax=Penaeus japonicus TaxID=27405 RepID=UPI001C713090|nr:uncharacterized protein LOC122243037 [Penaeus japonicus]